MPPLARCFDGEIPNSNTDVFSGLELVVLKVWAVSRSFKQLSAVHGISAKSEEMYRFRLKRKMEVSTLEISFTT
jgi:hypothetical protein